MAKYTPGPWKTRYGNISDADEGFGIVSEIDPGFGIVAECWPCSTDLRKRQQLRANAQLIAAAPDLLFHAKAILHDGNLEGLVVGAEQAGVQFNYGKLFAIVVGLQAAIDEAEEPAAVVETPAGHVGKDVVYELPYPPKAVYAAGSPQWAHDVTDRVVRRVAELPDRTSPDDWPEAMLVTADELREIIAEETRRVAPRD